MNAPLHHAYRSALSPAKDPRAAEAAILARITARLASAAHATDFPQLAAALNDNRRFWTAAAVDLAGEGNGLPPDLRASLISLAGFVIRHTSAILSDGAAADPLVEVNRAVIHGLGAQQLAA